MAQISIAAARVNAKLTQKELAEKLGVSNNTVCSWENGTTEIPLRYLQALANLSGLSISDIFVPLKSDNIVLKGEG
jgi:transcriptional regulator with XRE-family HTH domain